jgi:hypothetical protein
MQITTKQPVSVSVPSSTLVPWLDVDSEKNQLIEDWWVTIDGVPSCVPAGYITDWASIPSWIEWLYPHDARPFRCAALFHDYCYSHLWPMVSKGFADKAFREILKASGVPVWRRWAFWGAVRVGGKGGWHRVKDPNAHPFWREQEALFTVV